MPYDLEPVDLATLPAAATIADTDLFFLQTAAAVAQRITGLTFAQVLAGRPELAALYQPVDSDLTAIAALTTTAFGRSLLTGATAAATRTLLGLGTAATSAVGDFQPADSDLTSLAALTTTVYGRGFLELASQAALVGLLPAYIEKSLVDAKGDLIVATAGDTVARKAVGTDGHFLRPKAANADGLEWSAIGGYYLKSHHFGDAAMGSYAVTVTLTAISTVTLTDCVAGDLLIGGVTVDVQGLGVGGTFYMQMHLNGANQANCLVQTSNVARSALALNAIGMTAVAGTNTVQIMVNSDAASQYGTQPYGVQTVQRFRAF